MKTWLNQLEMYIASVDGFEGEGDILSKFGLEIRDRVELIVSRKRFEQTVGDYEIKCQMKLVR